MAVEAIHDLLGYDGLKIIQRDDMFRFSLDSTLLADFVNVPPRAQNILDLGTGNAPVPLFLSLKTKASIIGVDVQDVAVDLATRSVALNDLADQITIKHQDIRGIHKHYRNGEFDIVTCNPPFFKYTETSNVNDHEAKTIARHEVLVTLADIVFEAKRLLKTGGSLCLVHRTERLIEVIETLRNHAFSLKRMRLVYPRMGENSNMFLVEAANNGNTTLTFEAPLYVHEGDQYSEEINRIFGYGKETSR